MREKGKKNDNFTETDNKKISVLFLTLIFHECHNFAIFVKNRVMSEHKNVYKLFTSKLLCQ